MKRLALFHFKTTFWRCFSVSLQTNSWSLSPLLPESNTSPHCTMMWSGTRSPAFASASWFWFFEWYTSIFQLPGRGEFCPWKITVGNILSEISGQYFYQGFKQFFPLFYKECSISSCNQLKKKYNPKLFLALRAKFPFYPSKPRGDRIFSPIF